MSVQTIAAAAYLVLKQKRKRQKCRKFWCQELYVNSDVVREEFFNKLLSNDEYLFKNFTRMTSQDFDHLLDLVRPLISKSDTNFRSCIPAEVKLQCTLRFLATGDSFHSLMYLFRISVPSISIFIPQVCNAIITVLKEYIKKENTREGKIPWQENYV